MKHFAELEGLRGWLSCWVVTAHILSRSGYHPETLPFPLALIRQGTPAVLVFIVLSGFVITHLLMNSKQSYAPFLFRRFMRLYPVFLVTLLAAMSLHWMQIDVLKAVAPYSTAERATGLIEQYRSTEDHFFAHMAAHLPMLHGLVDQRLLPNSAYAFLGTAWSISLEWQFYLIAPLVVLALMRQPVITIVSLAAAGYLLRHRLVLNEAFLINAIVYFAVGIGWAHYVNRPSRINAVLAVSMTAFVFVIGSQVAILIWAAVMALILRPVPPPQPPPHPAVDTMARQGVLFDLSLAHHHARRRAMVPVPGGHPAEPGLAADRDHLPDGAADARRLRPLLPFH